MKKYGIVLIVVIIAAGGWWWRVRAAGNGQVEYETVAASRGGITMVVSASGTINPVATVLVGSQVSGRILSLYADYNSVVTCGQVVAQLEGSPFVTRVRQCEAARARARALNILAKSKYERQQTLAEQKIASSAELDDARAVRDEALAQEMEAQASLDSAQIDLQHATIYSPVDGTVLTRSVDVGQTVAATFQAPTLFTIAADLTKMQIEAMVDEADVGSVAVGQAVLFTVDAYPEQSFSGMVRQVRHSPQVVQSVVSYDTIISVDNSGMKLKPGMTANTTIIVSNRADVLLVPNAALRFTPPASAQAPTPVPRALGAGAPGPAAGRSQQTLFVLSNGAPVSVRVAAGITDGAATEILSGLAEGAPVIVGIAPAGTSAAQATVNPFAPARYPARRK